MEHQWRDEREWVMFRVNDGIRVEVEWSANGKWLPWEGSRGVAAREILRLAERVAEIEKTASFALFGQQAKRLLELEVELQLWKSRNSTLANSRETIDKECRGLAQRVRELEIEREQMAPDGAGASAIYVAEVRHLQQALQKASEEIGGLKGWLAIERDRREQDQEARHAAEELAAREATEKLRLGRLAIIFDRAGMAESRAASLNDKLKEARGTESDLRDRIDGLEQENYRLRDGIERVRAGLQDALDSPATFSAIDLTTALDNLKVAAEGSRGRAWSANGVDPLHQMGKEG